MFTYNQSTGELFHGYERIAEGYSGTGDGRNNSSMENVHDVGPIPCNDYHICNSFDSDKFGPIVMRLDKLHFKNTRDGFLIHGDNVTHDASHGCIILPRAARVYIKNSGDKFLHVTSGLPISISEAEKPVT